MDQQPLALGSDSLPKPVLSRQSSPVGSELQLEPSSPVAFQLGCLNQSVTIPVSCSVPFGLDNAAFPFLAYSGIPVVSFGFYDVSIAHLPA